MKFNLTFVVFLLLTGCANYETMTTEEFSERQSVENSGFERHVKLDGGRIIADLPSGIFETGQIYLRFRGWIDKHDTNAQSHQLYVAINYFTLNSWRFYNRATFYGGEVASLTEISRDVNYCTTYQCDYTEVVGIAMPMDKILLGDPIQIQITAKSGHKAVISIPQNYVLAYFDLIRENTDLLSQASR